MRNDNNQLLGGGAVEKEIRPVVIHNRDIPLLADVLPIMQEICQIEQRRDWQRDRMLNITQHLTGMPGGGSVPKGLDEAILAKLDEAFAFAVEQAEVADFCNLKSFTLMPMTREESQAFLDTFTAKACYLLWDADACANNPADFGIER